MGYVGNQTSNSYTSLAKQTITGDGGASYTLDHAVANVNEIEVFVNNVRQEPSVAYTVSGTALTMTGNVQSSDDFYVVFQGKAIQTVVPPEDSVTPAMLTGGAGFASGMVMPFAGTTAPTGWLFAYGQSVASATYPDLYAAIGTTYGGNATNFNLPDLRGRVVAGQDDMGSTSANRLTNQSGGLNGDTLGATGGSETHTLTTAQMPSHQHSVYQHAGYHGGSVQGAGAGDSGTTVHAATTGPTGGGGAHNNVQPTIILNYIIKT
jgi:microcystin-dependent protein